MLFILPVEPSAGLYQDRPPRGIAYKMLSITQQKDLNDHAWLLHHDRGPDPCYGDGRPWPPPCSLLMAIASSIPTDRFDQFAAPALSVWSPWLRRLDHHPARSWPAPPWPRPLYKDMTGMKSTPMDLTSVTCQFG